MTKIAFIGLGVMGFPMAGHLAAAGHDLTVYNRTTSKAQSWVQQHGGASAASPKEAASGADIIFTCVGNDDDLRSVTLGDNGAFAGLSKGALFVDHSTVSADVAHQLADLLAEQGCESIDAPVSGGQAGAENGKLAIMCGGSDSAMDRARPVMDVYAARIVHIGGVGAGQTTKMVNQICIAGVLAGLSEGIRFAQASALDLGKVKDAISGGAAQSWQMDNRWDSMTQGQFDFGFAIDWMRKDLGLALEEARRNGASLPTAAAVDQYYAEVQAMGGNRQDTSALIRRLRKSGESN